MCACICVCACVCVCMLVFVCVCVCVCVCVAHLHLQFCSLFTIFHTVTIPAPFGCIGESSNDRLIVSMLKRRAVDNKVGVRKAAIQASYC